MRERATEGGLEQTDVARIKVMKGKMQEMKVKEDEDCKIR